MLSKLEEAIKELEKQKEELLERFDWRDLDHEDVLMETRTLYQKWYSAARVIISKNQPDRLKEFDRIYFFGVRSIKYILEESYPSVLKGELKKNLSIQFGILAAVPTHLKFSAYDIELTAYSILMDDEIDAARYLLKNGFLRAAGALAGVTLERHLKNLLRKHAPPIKYSKTANLSKLNDLCKDQIYDTVVWRKVQHLTDLRNLCDHDKEREPTKDEVTELIDGVSAFLKTHPTP